MYVSVYSTDVLAWKQAWSTCRRHHMHVIDLLSSA
jgi:hypothetical protein